MAAERHLLTDIRLDLRDARLRPVYAVAVDRKPLPNGGGLRDDLGLVQGVDNLGQAVLLRLLTPRGELAALAHPDYGSRLHELIGRVNTETTRNLVKLFILESLKQESRIATIDEVTVTPTPGSRERVDVFIRVKPIARTTTGTASVTIGPFTLELGL